MAHTQAAEHAAPHGDDEFHDDIIYPATLPFLLVHLVCVAAIWTGVTWQALALCVVLYVARMFGVTAGYHRYFSHRSFKTSRLGQFLLAALAQSSAQRGALWWAAKHRHHHRHSDTEEDVHSPRHRGFWYSHLGWIFVPKHEETDFDAVPDLTKYPELVWLEKHPLVPAVVLGVLSFLLLGWSGLVVGFFWSTVLLYHGTFMINSLAHVHGKQRYVTGDDSRNNWWLALITLGEGWHNNHHAYQSSTRQGFRWYEVDPTYYTLKAMSWVGLVWDLRSPPEEVVRNERKLGRAVVEKVAHQLAASFPVERMARELAEQWERSHVLDDLKTQLAEQWERSTVIEDLKAQARAAQAAVQARLATVEMPQLPSLEDVRARARQMYEQAPEIQLDEIAARARQLVLEAVSTRLATAPALRPA
jgi:stearoyl-CoA desaturase (delta-9 desaturase)